MKSRYIKIKILMLKNGVENQTISSLAGCDSSLVSHVIRGVRFKGEKAKHVQDLLSLKLGVPVDKIFPCRKAA